MNNNENLYLSTIAFLDDDAITTNNRYLAEFCKIVIYQNGYSGLELAEVCQKINELVLFSYAEDEIERILSTDKNSFEFDNGRYYITSAATKEISKREKTFPLRRYVDLFCDTRYGDDDNINRNQLCELVTKYIFEKFQQSIEQISGILDCTKEMKIEFSDKYTNEERAFLNTFLTWDNDEKNKMIYKLIVKSYDFCTINCTEKSSFNFENFHFYLDANIIMRLLGINNTYRQNAIKHFIEKCKQENIQLHVSNFTKVEIQRSIEHQIHAIDQEIKERKHIQTPDAMKFAKPDTFTIELYGKYYEYGKKNKDWSLEAFKRSLMAQLDACIQNFIYDDKESFEVVDADKFNNYVSSLKTQKDEKVVKTDVNNVMLVMEARKQNMDSCMISADGKLINWCREIFVGKRSIVEFPSTWLSIIMKYTGRASTDDYASFCKFIRLPIYTSDKDIKAKIAVKKHILKMDTTAKIKNRMFEELENNYFLYSDSVSSQQIADNAYNAIMVEHDNNIIKKVKQQKNVEIEKINEKNESAKQSLISQIKQKDILLAQQEARTVDVKIEEAIRCQVQKHLQIGQFLKKYKSNIILVIIGILIVISLIICFLTGSKIEINLFTLAAIATIFDVFIIRLINSILNAIIERYANSEHLYNKYKRKYYQKYKDLLPD